LYAYSVSNIQYTNRCIAIITQGLTAERHHLVCTSVSHGDWQTGKFVNVIRELVEDVYHFFFPCTVRKHDIQRHSEAVVEVCAKIVDRRRM